MLSTARAPLFRIIDQTIRKNTYVARITTTRNIQTTSVKNGVVKDNAVDMGEAASIDAAAEIPGERNPTRWAKLDKVTREALDKIPGEKGVASDATKAGVTSEKKAVSQQSKK